MDKNLRLMPEESESACRGEMPIATLSDLNKGDDGLPTSAGGERIDGEKVWLPCMLSRERASHVTKLGHCASA